MSNEHDPFANLNRKYAELHRFYDDNCDEAWEQIKHPFRNKKTARFAIAGCVLLALCLMGVLVFKSLFVRPELPGRNGWHTNKDGKIEVNIDYGDGIQPALDGERKSEDYYTVLVLGRDTGGGGNTDTMLLASYDVTNQKAAVMSIPRDTMVNVSWDVKKINSVYNMNGTGEKGIQAVYREVSQLVGFEPDYKVVVEWEAVGNIVDAIGGVYFDVPYNMDYHDPYQNLVIEQQKGYRLLNGDDAMQVIRWRKNDRNSPYGSPSIGDSGRMEIQQSFLKAVIQQMMQPKNVLNINKIAKVVKENVETDLSLQNMLWFGEQAFSGGLSLDDVSFFTMPWKGVHAYSRSLGTNLDYVVPIPDQLLDIVNHQLSPFKQVFTLSNLDIMSVNADGSISSSTGHVEDAKAAVAPAYSGKTGALEDPKADSKDPSEAGDVLDTGESNETETPGNTTDTPEQELPTEEPPAQEPTVSEQPIPEQPIPEQTTPEGDDSGVPDWLREFE